jgi:hypothetical protein
MAVIDEHERLHRRLRRNVRCVAGLGFFQVFLVIIPVIGPFLGERGLSTSEVLLLQTTFVLLAGAGLMVFGLLLVPLIVAVRAQQAEAAPAVQTEAA